VGLDGAVTEVEPSRDLLVGQALSHGQQHLALALGPRRSG
jgi:hypothetical protein